MVGSAKSILYWMPYYKLCVVSFNLVRQTREAGVSECLSSPCQHAGSCDDNADGYTCACAGGYTGGHCETEINECALYTPCQNNGRCLDFINGYVCNCTSTGYLGYNCTYDMTECILDVCRHGGDCSDVPGGYQCHCRHGYTGRHCESEIHFPASTIGTPTNYVTEDDTTYSEFGSHTHQTGSTFSDLISPETTFGFNYESGITTEVDGGTTNPDYNNTLPEMATTSITSDLTWTKSSLGDEDESATATNSVETLRSTVVGVGNKTSIPTNWASEDGIQTSTVSATNLHVSSGSQSVSSSNLNDDISLPRTVPYTLSASGHPNVTTTVLGTSFQPNGTTRTFFQSDQSTMPGTSFQTDYNSYNFTSNLTPQMSVSLAPGNTPKYIEPYIAPTAPGLIGQNGLVESDTTEDHSGVKALPFIIVAAFAVVVLAVGFILYHRHNIKKATIKKHKAKGVGEEFNTVATASKLDDNELRLQKRSGDAEASAKPTASSLNSVTPESSETGTGSMFSNLQISSSIENIDERDSP